MRSFLKAAALAAALLGVAVNAEAASVALLTGPLEPSQQLANFNSLIISMNSAFGSAGAGNIGVGLNVPAVASAVNAISLTAGATGVVPIIGVGSSAGQSADANIGVALNGAGTGSVYLGGTTAANAAASVAHGTTNVNQIILTGTNTGGTDTITVGGSGADANAPLALAGKGTGNVLIGGITTSLAGLQVTQTASAVNDFVLTNAATSSTPGFEAGGAGSDASVGVAFGTQGTGNIAFDTAANVEQFEIDHTASAVNFLKVTGTTGTTALAITAAGTGANLNINLVPKGTGTVVPVGGISAASQGGVVQTVSARNMAACGVTGLTNNTATANAATTDVYVTEIWIPATISTTGVAVLNGTTAANSSTIYLADVAGNQVAHTASTAVSGTSAYQLIAWVGGPIQVNGPGTYYLYFTNNGTTNTWETINNGACGTALVTGATYGTFKATTPPTTFTTAQGPIGSLY